MPERGFDTGFWTEDFVMGLAYPAKLLFHYLGSNDHCNQAGVYHIAPKTIAFETGLPESDLPSLLKMLHPEVKWLAEGNIIWVKNFLEKQAKSSKFVIAAIKALNSHKIPDEIRTEFESYNEELLHGVAPSEHVSPTKRECVIIRDNFQCQYCGHAIKSADDYEMDHVIPVAKGGKDNYQNLVTCCRSCNQKKGDRLPQEAGLPSPTPGSFHGAQAVYILKNNKSVRERWLSTFPDRYKVVESILFNIGQYYSGISSVSVSVSKSRSGSDKEKRVVKGKEEPIPRSRMEAEETLCEGDQEVISVWCSVEGFNLAPSAAAELVARLRTEFLDLDLLAESKAWAARKLSEPLIPSSKPSAQIWNWMRVARKIAQERRSKDEQKGHRAPVHSRGDFREPWLGGKQ